MTTKIETKKSVNRIIFTDLDKISCFISFKENKISFNSISLFSDIFTEFALYQLRPKELKLQKFLA